MSPLPPETIAAARKGLDVLVPVPKPTTYKEAREDGVFFNVQGEGGLARVVTPGAYVNAVLRSTSVEGPIKFYLNVPPGVDAASEGRAFARKLAEDGRVAVEHEDREHLQVFSITRL